MKLSAINAQATHQTESREDYMSCNGCSFNNSTSSITQGYDWLSDLPDTTDKSDIVEVKFKSTRKEYYKNVENLPLKRGDRIVVASSPGHDVGEVTLTGYLAEKQFKLRIKNPSRYDLNVVYRKASDADIQKLNEARSREKATMIRARQAAQELGLDMKIGDVEFRGDNKKAIFYYLAEGRVDFRELIKVYAREFRIKVEMKQIGARQEAGLIGGIGSCGRELCCSSWRTDFSSISSEAALKQGLSPSAQKMAGACGKLKCCLLYELDAYIEAGNEFPRELLDLELASGIAKPFKTDYLKKEIWYGLQGSMGTTFNLSLKQVRDIIQKNKRGIKPEVQTFNALPKEQNSMEVTLDESLDRFDDKKPARNKNRRNNRGTNKKGGRNFENKSNTAQNKQTASEGGDKNKRPNKRRNNNPNRKRKQGFQAKKAQPASGNNNSN
ncbi:PSP1 domain-containing protein [Draconibacterium mangrovi]|uniref:PSP1 domain-containing protein n=1 Tax=Draconibacterium mangrovi TaxID=2697469 RepID=UPI0013D3D213|nr:regulatory iron-sulfur-containing complex subunit RicT [Draconibacterium mangrovi]